MNKRIVSLAQAKKCLSGHRKYLETLKWEYANPNADGSLTQVIDEMDRDHPNDADFDCQLCNFLEEIDCTETRFVTLAMLGTDADDTDWS